MINQLKLLILLSRYKWLFVFLFVATISFDIYLYTIMDEDTGAGSLFNYAFYVYLMFLLRINHSIIRNQNSRELYFIQPKTKQKMIFYEWKVVLLLNFISYIFWSIEIILSKEAIMIVPLLYVYSVSILLNAILLYGFYYKHQIYQRLVKVVYIMSFVGINLIFKNLESEYLLKPNVANQIWFNVLPYVVLLTTLLISFIIINISILNSNTKSLIWEMEEPITR